MDTVFIYILYGVSFGLLGLSYAKNKKKTAMSLKRAWRMFLNVLPQFSSILLLVGLLLAVLNPSVIQQIIGENSGIYGMLITGFLGSVSLVPAIIAFPIAAELLKNGAGLMQIAVFISTLTTVGFVTFPLEVRYLGKKTALLRNVLAFLFSFAVAAVTGGGIILKKVIKKYKLLFAVFAISLSVFIIRPETGITALCFTGRNIINFVVILVPVFILIGLMDVWITRETMIRLMGNRSGLHGALLAFLLGAVTAVPIYALLPVAGILLKKGCRVSNVLIFLCSSAGVRLPLLLFEISSLGWKFTMVRFSANIIAVFAIAFITNGILSATDKEQIYENASKQE